MRRSIIFVIGLHGFGFDRGDVFPELRLGLVSISWCKGRWIDVINEAAKAKAAAA
ncbi:hypothetical protein [Rhodovarius crocodyli]|uniref:hypothetical protein n=1 Tax=Rhodovarius crocodyli TaxID=1979269 RepID=UPI0013E2BAAD|nr:hypothetical protein [Rhodovarius crocodyli]